ncbi:AAA family ATPase [Candidatus Pacearchaeota archaeon]|nr:AAA family ATPase [Candidatus Pacearchaeota archaeon]
MGKSIGVISLKGGVGKTSVVASLGSAIAGFDKKVLLVDGNLSAPNLGIHFRIIDPEMSLHHVLNREINAKDAVHSLENVDILPASVFTDRQVNPLKLKDRMDYLKKKYDYIFYDSSPSLSDETLGVMLASDILFVVSTPDHPTLSTTLKAIKSAKERGVPIQGIIINKVHNKKFEIPLEHIEETLEIPVVAVIPYDINILEALSKFVPSVERHPKSEASEEYRKLAAALVGEEYKPPRLRSFFRWRDPPKQDINRLVLYQNVFGD